MLHALCIKFILRVIIWRRKLLHCDWLRAGQLSLLLLTEQEQVDALVDRKESLKQELKNTQDELQTCKESHRYISNVLSFNCSHSLQGLPLSLPLEYCPIWRSLTLRVLWEIRVVTVTNWLWNSHVRVQVSHWVVWIVQSVGFPF